MSFDRKVYWRIPFIALALAFLADCGGGGGGAGTGPAPPTAPNPPAPPESRTVFEYSSPDGAEFAIYLPPGISTFRGVYVLLGGSGGDTRQIVDRKFQSGHFRLRGGDFDKPVFQAFRTRVLALAQEHGLAVLGVARPNNSNLPSAMTALAAESQHPELATAPFVLAGYSGGGCFAYHFTREHADRVIGFWTERGGCHREGDGLGAKEVPGVLVIGGAGTEDRCLNLTAVFENNRPAGALWALAVEPGARIDSPLGSVLEFSWMDTVLESRLPATATPGASPVLRPISEGSGWLGDRETAAVAQFDEYDKDVGQASWLPSAQTAADWSSFVSPGRPLACSVDADG